MHCQCVCIQKWRGNISYDKEPEKNPGIDRIGRNRTRNKTSPQVKFLTHVPQFNKSDSNRESHQIRLIKFIEKKCSV